MTPNFAVVRIENGGRRWGIPIVVPLFLLWIPAILLGPLVLLVLWAVCIAVDVSFLNAVSTFWGIVCGLRGTDVRVCADGNRITVRIL
ncbi:MAG TPA: hypothetical protein VKR52_19830 [Terracidiphilus sp.]|nr:hypothetical protein [Terracidiphilus sp.]